MSTGDPWRFEPSTTVPMPKTFTYPPSQPWIGGQTMPSITEEDVRRIVRQEVLAAVREEIENYEVDIEIDDIRESIKSEIRHILGRDNVRKMSQGDWLMVKDYVDSKIIDSSSVDEQRVTDIVDNRIKAALAALSRLITRI